MDIGASALVAIVSLLVGAGVSWGMLRARVTLFEKDGAEKREESRRAIQETRATVTEIRAEFTARLERLDARLEDLVKWAAIAETHATELTTLRGHVQSNTERIVRLEERSKRRV